MPTIGNIKWLRKKYWVYRNIFSYNPALRSLFGQCRFCEGEYFKKEDAIAVEVWDMPSRTGEGRTYFNWETHKCKECGQHWRHNRISFEKVDYDFD